MIYVAANRDAILVGIAPSVGATLITVTELTRTVLAELAKMPEGAWSFLASLLALTGVFVTISIQGRHIRTQLEAGKRAQDRDREMSMRREIYLGAAEAVSAGIRSLGRFVDPHLSTENVLGNYLERLSWISKLYVVANPKTIQAVANIVGAIDGAQLRMSALRVQLLEKHRAVGTVQRAIEIVSKDQEHVLDALKQHHHNGINDREKFDRLESTHIFFDNQLKRYAADEVEKLSDVFEFQVLMTNASQNEQALLIDPLVEALVEIRSELELPISSLNLAEVFAKSLAAGGLSLDEYVRKVTRAREAEKQAA